MAPVTDHTGLITHFVAIAADIDQQKAMEAALQRLAVTDPLTGAANRRRLFEQGESEILRTRRTGEPTAMLMLDIDHFKQINDAHGHPAGDAVIRALATEATKMVRAIDTVGRFGGEEFAILLPLTGTPGAIDIAERLRASVAALAMTWQQEVISFTVSIGVAVATTSTADFDELVTMADTALYRAKNAGRNRVALCAAAD